MRKPSRQSFLKTMGSLSLGLPFVRLLESSVVYAQSARPRRLLILMSPHGTLVNNWRPKAVGTDFDINYPNAILGPLNAFKDKICVLDGIDYKVLHEKATTGHDYGHSTFLTGTPPYEKSTTEVPPTGPSIDQVIGAKLHGLAPRDTLSLGVYDEGGTYKANSMIFDSSAQPVKSLIDPRTIYPLLFTGVVPPGGGAPPDPAATADQRRKMALVSYLNGEANRVMPRLAGQEREKLQRHIDALADIERRLSGPTIGGSAGDSCDPSLISGGTLDPHRISNIPTIIDLQFDIIAQAFACDLTRVISFQFLQGGSITPMEWIGLTGDLHDGLAHFAGTGDSAVDAKYLTMQRWYSQKVAELFARLDAIQDPQGGSVLDNTVVLWGNELGQPSLHSSVNIPMIMAGGGAGAFQTGRWLKYSTSSEPRCSGVYGNCPASDPFRDQTAHNQVLTSIAQMFGLEVNYFGDPKYTGTLPGLMS